VGGGGGVGREVGATENDMSLVAPRPASRLLSSEGERAQMKAWKEETVNTPSLFSVFFVGRETCVSSDC